VFVGLVLRHVQDVQKVMRSHLQRLVPGDVPLAEATAMWEAFDAIERQAGAAKTLLAARVEESRAWARAGDRSVEEHLARKAGTSRGAARCGVETSKRLRGLPATEAALRRGELSQAQAETITNAAAVNPSAERSLLDTARTSTLVELRERARRAKAAGDPDPDATHRRVHRQRRLRRFTDGEGAWSLYGRGTPDAGAIFNATLDPIIDEMFGVARREGRHESRDAYAFDALIELARRARGGTPTSAAPSVAAPAPTSPGANAGTRAGDPCDAAETTLRSVGIDTSDRPGPGDGGVPPARRTAGLNPSFLALLRVDVEALARGGVEGDELCEIAGVGPVPARVARGLLGDAVLKLVITRGVDVVNVTHLGRGPSAAQSVALLWSSPGCTNSECDHTLLIQHDHRTPWAEVHETTLANLDRLCPQPCHHRKTHDGWALVEGTGRRPLVPPDHPRHPDNTGHTGASPPAAGAPPDATTTRPEPPEPTLFDTDAA
jgi:hypothetical protein